MSSPAGVVDQDHSKGMASQKAGGQERAGGPIGSGGGNAGAQAAAKALGPAENLQTALKGPPKMSGLTSFEYNVDSQLRYNCADTKPDNVDQASTERYQKIFHREEFLSRANSNANSQGDSAKADDLKSSTAGGSSINRKNIQIETDKHIFSLAENDALNRGQKASIHAQFPLNKGRTAGATETGASLAEAKQGLHHPYPQ